MKKLGPETSIDIIGMGHVGTATALYLYQYAPQISCIDINSNKISTFQKQQAPFYEPNLQEELIRFSENPKNCFSTQINPESKNTHRFYIICVGTPTTEVDQNVDLSQVTQALLDISKCITSQPSIRHTIVVRSTLPPGCCRQHLIPLLEKETQLKENKDFYFYFQPEFLREGSALKDLKSPSQVVIGCSKKVIESQDLSFFKLFFGQRQPSLSTFESAEMIKYFNNGFHALKISFVNEIATLAKQYNVDLNELSELFLSDNMLNISSQYLKPGFAFGGICLHKELQALNQMSATHQVQTPLLESILQSNTFHIHRFIHLIRELKIQNVGFIGVTFKPNTSDLRYSPMLKVIETLATEDQCHLYIHDRPLTMKQVTSKFLFSKYECLPQFQQILERTNAVVLGPYQLSPNDFEQLHQYKGQIIDLKWFAVPDFIQNMTNYTVFP